ncbi:hypothetical protein FF011L_23100 [Roseimaritima multifibrata]|uniref:Uncharacterized protein n=2 Tax=Roseimaritima multifibrata TaxID=1930274 RepID=A0A517MF74_9BACT|nr:hypothetical protein FF011L_23100 [Roseimaritima multifibrata]
MQFQCTSCGRQLEIPAEAANRSIRCPACMAVISAGVIDPAGGNDAAGPLSPEHPPTVDPLAVPANPYTAPIPSPDFGTYQTPIGVGGNYTGGRTDPVLYILPGVLMMCMAGIALLMNGLGLIGTMLNAPQLDAGDLVAALVWLGPGAAVNGFILIGGIQMIRRRSLVLCRIASILAVIPYFGICCVGNVPFGIWACVMVFSDNATRDFQ